MSDKLENIFNSTFSVFSGVVSSTPGTLVAGAVLGVYIGVLYNRRQNIREEKEKQRRINEAIINKDMGMQYADLSYTVFQRTNKGETTQHIRSLHSKFNLAVSFEGEAQERYVEYLARAAKLASQSDTNPYILDYLDQAIEECHKDIDVEDSSFKQLDKKEIRKQIVNDINLDIGRFVDSIKNDNFELFTGVKLSENKGARLYPVMVAEKDGEGEQIKIYLLREYDLNSTIIPDDEAKILINTDEEKYENDLSHPDALRWRTIKLMRDRLRNNPEMRKEIKVTTSIPGVLRLYDLAKLKKVGVVQRRNIPGYKPDIAV